MLDTAAYAWVLGSMHSRRSFRCYWKRYGWGIWLVIRALAAHGRSGGVPGLIALGFVGLLVALEIAASLKRRGWGTWSGATNLDAGPWLPAYSRYQRPCSSVCLLRWWWSVAPLV